MYRNKKTQVAVEKEVTSAIPKSRVRDRIMQTAIDLFYRLGIRAVGVDAIANGAGTNKTSFYRNFASKDELVVEYLRGEERDRWRRPCPMHGPSSAAERK
jgi:AcrR family transcriptional regulator